jgi:hypothetical protein
MTAAKILAAATVGFLILIAAGTAFRDAYSYAPQPSAGSDFDERWIPIKSDRLPSSTSAPLAVAEAESVPPPPVAAPLEQLPLATEDDMRQAEAEHHRHRDICPHGRTYFTIEHHQYWRCVR